ncbi:hypothetical protein [Lewinella cohaerens]|uniref:hypothetical protein n=1 Tax=Lewinella cohaerens TaxID=70995 RepID=UPI00037A34AB|nr:hypothetical protein [Lewinella cohaerens]
MQDTTRKPNTLKLVPKGAKQKKLSIILAGCATLIVVAFLFSNQPEKQKSPTPNTVVTDEIREARIAILPFENKTGDRNLNALGDMAADWIIQGLMFVDDIQLVSFETIQGNIKQKARGFSDSFTARTGAEKIVKGRYYLSGNDLIFQSQLVDTNTGRVELRLPTIQGPRQDYSALVSQLQEKYATAFSAKGHSYSLGVAHNPPVYEAYQLYREGADIYSEDFAKSIALQNQAIAADSSFFWPYIFVAGAYFMDGEKNNADSVFALIAKRVDLDNLPRVEKQWYLHWQAILNKDLRTALETMLKVVEMDPKQFLSNMEAGIMANDLNRPVEAIRIMSNIDPRHVKPEFDSHTWWHRHYAHNLYRLGRYDEAVNILSYIPPKLRRHWNYFDRMAEIHVAQNQPHELQQLVEEMLSNEWPATEKLSTFLFIAERFGAAQKKEQQIAWAEKAIAWANDQAERSSMNSYVLGDIYFLAEQYNKALPLLQKAITEAGPSWLQMTKEGPGWLQLSRLASCYFHLQKPAKAKQYLQQMEAWYTKTQDGGYLIAQAHIYTLLNDREAAVRLIKAAFEKALPYDPANYANDIMFAPLQGYEPFDDFVAPQG